MFRPLTAPGRLLVPAASLVALLLAGCGGGEALEAKAVISGTAGSTLKGTATFTEVDGGTRVVVEVEGAPPGDHAVHLHQTGDCSAADFSSAGGHFNPDGHAHGKPGEGEHHPGDFGNMTVAADGTGKLELVADELTVAAGKYSVVGKSIIVHDKPDDFGQPTGNAGGRIGCGVVE